MRVPQHHPATGAAAPGVRRPGADHDDDRERVTVHPGQSQHRQVPPPRPAVAQGDSQQLTVSVIGVPGCSGVCRGVPAAVALRPAVASRRRAVPVYRRQARHPRARVPTRAVPAPVDVTARRGHDPRGPGVYKFRGRARPGHLRRQGQEPAAAAELVLRRPAALHPRPRRWSTSAGRVEWTVVTDRGRGAAAGVHLDQGVRPAVQRPLPGRQVVPVPGRDRWTRSTRGCR
jgi:hypothetical protein